MFIPDFHGKDKAIIIMPTIADSLFYLPTVFFGGKRSLTGELWLLYLIILYMIMVGESARSHIFQANPSALSSQRSYGSHPQMQTKSLSQLMHNSWRSLAMVDFSFFSIYMYGFQSIG
jgi:hypothetical protein